MAGAVLIRIKGFVQGVGFRAFLLREARALGLRGWVRNRLDGSVEALAQGSQEALEAFVARCRQGPYGARVTDVQVQASSAPPGEDFRQLPTA